MSETLAQRTIQVLEEKGWTQNTRRDNEGRMCIAGAVNFALHGDAWWAPPGAWSGGSEAWKLFRVIEDVLGPETRGGGNSPIVYNDTPGRTVEEIIDVLRRADERMGSE